MQHLLTSPTSKTQNDKHQVRNTHTANRPGSIEDYFGRRGKGLQIHPSSHGHAGGITSGGQRLVPTQRTHSKQILADATGTASDHARGELRERVRLLHGGPLRWNGDGPNSVRHNSGPARRQTPDGCENGGARRVHPRRGVTARLGEGGSIERVPGRRLQPGAGARSHRHYGVENHQQLHQPPDPTAT